MADKQVSQNDRRSGEGRAAHEAHRVADAEAAVLEINRRLRHALADISERERIIRQQADHAQRLNERLQATLAQLQATQQQIIQQERLRALGQMASGIAHDLNNALSSVLGFTELLLNRPEALHDPDKSAWYLHLIHTGAQDAAAYVGRLREFYRPRAPGEHSQLVSLPPLIEQSVALTQPRWRDQALAEGRTITVRTELGPLPLVTGNEPELREALTNLIFNSVDALPQGGTITLRAYVDKRRKTKDRRPTTTDHASSTTHQPDSPFVDRPSSQRWLVLEVADTGTGMTEEVRRRAAEPFFTTKGEHGTGLGLAMVYSVAQRHGGTLEFASAVGKGTTVRLVLPVAPAAAGAGASIAAPGAASGASPEGAGRRAAGKPRQRLHVLVVDDEPAVRTFTVAFLQTEGHTAEAAAGGEEALRRLEEGRFDLVITDHAMPGMTGDLLAAAIKAAHPALPVFMLTGFGELVRTAVEHAEAIDLVLSKPLTFARLREALVSLQSEVRSPKSEVADSLS